MDTGFIRRAICTSLGFLKLQFFPGGYPFAQYNFTVCTCRELHRRGPPFKLLRHLHSHVDADRFCTFSCWISSHMLTSLSFFEPYSPL
jgi:hypothetical protein